jgi:hypothetical protein
VQSFVCTSLRLADHTGEQGAIAHSSAATDIRDENQTLLLLLLLLRHYNRQRIERRAKVTCGNYNTGKLYIYYISIARRRSANYRAVVVRINAYFRMIIALLSTAAQ